MAKSSSTDVTSSPHPSNHCSITCPTPSTPVLAAASSLPRPVPPFLTVETSLTSALDFAPRHCNPGMPTYSTRQDRHVMVLCPSPSSYVECLWGGKGTTHCTLAPVNQRSGRSVSSMRYLSTRGRVHSLRHGDDRTRSIRSTAENG